MKPRFAFLLCMFPLVILAERQRVSLDQNWSFHLGEVPLAQAAEFDDAGWRTLDVPHDWAIESAFSKEHSPRNAWLPGGIGWYRKRFDVGADDKGKRVELQFDGVYKRSTVWVNGELAGSQSDGYTSFYLDITAHIHFGAENVIAVRVDNSLQPNCRWFTGSGIYRHVWLTVKDPVHVENWGTSISTPKVVDSEAEVRVVTTVNNRTPKFRTVSLQTDLLNPAGEKVATRRSTLQLGATMSGEVDQTLRVFSPERWSLESPSMYTAVSRVYVGKTLVDEVHSPFGIREIRFVADQGFFLNGKNMKMKGVCLHSEAATFGAAIPVDVWEYRLTRLKEAGCNAIRTAHNQMAPEFMDLCDRMGFLVMDEFVDKWDDPQFADALFSQEWKKNFGETIRRDRNHPSVVIWSVGNENHAPGSEEQTSSLERYCDFVRSMDPTRPVVSGMERGLDKDPAEKVDDILNSAAHMDIIGMNYGLQWSGRIAHRKPGKVFVSTETYPYFSSTETERWPFIERNTWFDVMANDNNIGSFLWSGIKYMGEVPARGPDSWPNVFCWPGSILDSAGFKTDLAYFFQSLWTDEPVLHLAVYEQVAKYQKRWGAPPMQSHWNFEEGSEQNLVTYTNCEVVELYLNDRKISTQLLSDFSNGVMNWHRIGYEAGTLKVVGFREGKQVAEFTLTTAGAPASIRLGSTNVGDLLFVDAQLMDRSGNPVAHENRELTFRVDGGEILSLDHGLMTAELDFQNRKTRPTRNGKCLAVIKPSPGETVKLSVQADGLPEAAL